MGRRRGWDGWMDGVRLSEVEGNFCGPGERKSVEGALVYFLRIVILTYWPIKPVAVSCPVVEVCIMYSQSE